MEDIRLQIWVFVSCIKSTCIDSASTVKHLEIDLQFSQILEIEQYDTRLEIEVTVGW